MRVSLSGASLDLRWRAVLASCKNVLNLCFYVHLLSGVRTVTIQGIGSLELFNTFLLNKASLVINSVIHRRIIMLNISETSIQKIMSLNSVWTWLILIPFIHENVCHVVCRYLNIGVLRRQILSKVS